jgi:uncharacterized protein YggE
MPWPMPAGGPRPWRGRPGVGIGQVTAISESTQSIGPEPLYRAALDSVAKAPVEPGTQEVQATVSVTFAIE